MLVNNGALELVDRRFELLLVLLREALLAGDVVQHLWVAAGQEAVEGGLGGLNPFHRYVIEMTIDADVEDGDLVLEGDRLELGLFEHLL